MKSKEERLQAYKDWLEKQDHLSAKERQDLADMFSAKLDKEYEAKSEAEKKQAQAEQKQLIAMIGAPVATAAAIKGGDYLATALAEEAVKEVAAPAVISATRIPSDVAAAAEGVDAAAGAGGGAAGAGFWDATAADIGPAAEYLGPVGLAAGGYGMYNAAEQGDPLMGAVSGAGAGAGLGGTLSLLGIANPVLAPLAIAGALLGGGAGFLGGWDKDMWQTEQNRWGDLMNADPTWADIMPSDITNPGLSGGRSVGDLMAIDEANIAAGKWANPEFTQSRNESMLKPEDTWGYAAWGEQYGPGYMTQLSEDQRRQMNQAALDAGAVREHHGTIDVDFENEEYKKRLQEAGIAKALGV